MSLLHEHENRTKERRLKRVIAVLLIVCVVSVSMNVVNARHVERVRRGYLDSIVWDLWLLEKTLLDLHYAIETGEDMRRDYQMDFLALTANMISRDAVLLYIRIYYSCRISEIVSSTFGTSLETGVASIELLGGHLYGLLAEASDGRPEAALEFLDRRSKDIRQLIIDLAVESEHGYFRGPNPMMSVRQILNRINELMKCIEGEVGFPPRRMREIH